MLRNTRTVWLAGAIALCGCADETLSVGELHCAGEGVRCARPTPLALETRVPPPLHSLPEREAELLWAFDLPCPTEMCIPRATDVIVHPDGSVTVAFVFDAPLTLAARTAGVWLARFDTDGSMLWRDESLIETRRDDAEARLEAALALDGEQGDALLGVLRIGGDEITVYSVGASGGVEPLFRAREFTQLSAVAAVGADVLLLGNVWDGNDEVAPNPELARFERDGRQVWRQAALRQSDAAELSASKIGGHVNADMPMIVDADGGASLAVVEVSSFDPDLVVFAVVRVGPDGNVPWAANPELDSHLVSPFGVTPARLALDTRGRLVLADYDIAYTVARLDPEGEPPTRAHLVKAQRSPEEFWEPALMGLACDAADRMLVATTSGPRTAQRLLIDRYSEAFAERETFVLPSSQQPPPPGSYVTIDGILAAPDDSAMVWSTSGIARMALP